jgi:hypothetical protein
LNGSSYGTKNYNSDATFSGLTSLLNFIKINQLVEKLIGRQIHRQEGDLINLLLPLGRKVGYNSGVRQNLFES